MKREPWGVYIHVPFCKQKCFYCDFPSYAGKERYEAAYIDALVKEIQTEGARAAEKWGPPATLYIGGGTPSVLPCGLLENLLRALEETFCLRPSRGQQPLPLGEVAREARRSGSLAGRSNSHDVTHRGCAQESDVANYCEFTIECNPGTIDAEKLTLMKRHGVNRLSFGVQTFHDDLLKAIGRIHTAQQAREAIRLARSIGFQNLSLDLIYGLPGETLAMLQEDIDEALKLHPDHISIYGLQLEAGTAFWRMHETGKLHLPDDDTVEAMYDLMTTTLPAHGYARYEISNFARPGHESRHNLGYWQNKTYLGLGAAAHSYLDGIRYENTKDIAAYIDAIHRGELPRTQEEPATRVIRMEEFAFLALRTARGIDKAAFAETFGMTLSSVYAETVRSMQRKGLLEETDETVRLTPLGMKYGNYVFEAFLLS